MIVHRARVRIELLEEGLSIPVGDEYVQDNCLYEYRWIEDDSVFQVLHNGEWKEAVSTDWEFHDIKQPSLID